MPMFKLSNTAQHYDWGTTDFIPRLLNIAGDHLHPVAELWMGAHPLLPSLIHISEKSVRLNDYIQEAPQKALGQAADISSGQLPFLFKVLSAAKPLSIQAHPNPEQAREGFAKDNARGLKLDDPKRNYRDPLAKPEMMCALTPFKALCGFRAPEEVQQNFRALGLAEYFPSLNLSSEYVLAGFFREILSVSEQTKAQILQVFNGIVGQTISGLDANVLACCRMLAEHYPDDLGVLAPMYLNLFELKPGEALFLGAGVPHSYLSGSGLELMSSSDNVLRGGLTSKYVDTDELLRIVTPVPYTGSVITPVKQDEFLRYSAPVEEFVLYHLRGAAVDRAIAPLCAMPGIFLCTDGCWDIAREEQVVRLRQGESVFITAESSSLSVSGSGDLWLATVPQNQN